MQEIDQDVMISLNLVSTMGMRYVDQVALQAQKAFSTWLDPSDIHLSRKVGRPTDVPPWFVVAETLYRVGAVNYLGLLFTITQTLWSTSYSTTWNKRKF